MPGCPRCPGWMLPLAPGATPYPDPFSVCRWRWVPKGSVGSFALLVSSGSSLSPVAPCPHPCTHGCCLAAFPSPMGAPTTGPPPVPPPRGSHRLSGSVFPAGDPAAEEWSQWSVCSLTCGQGSQVRTRSCVSSPYGTLCSGLLRETRTCNNTATCPGMGGARGHRGLGRGGLRCRLRGTHRWLGSGSVPEAGGWLGRAGTLFCWGGVCGGVGVSRRLGGAGGVRGGAAVLLWKQMLPVPLCPGIPGAPAGIAPIVSPSPLCRLSGDPGRGGSKLGDVSGMGASVTHPIPPLLLPGGGFALGEAQPVTPLHPPSRQIQGFPRVSPRLCAGGEVGAGACAGGPGAGQRGGGGVLTPAGQEMVLPGSSRRVVGRSRQAGHRGSHWAVYWPICPWWHPCVLRGMQGIGTASGCCCSGPVRVWEPSGALHPQNMWVPTPLRIGGYSPVPALQGHRSSWRSILWDAGAPCGSLLPSRVS